MQSKQFMIELPQEAEEFDVYDALNSFGIKYARVKPVERYTCGCHPELELTCPMGGREQWEG